MPQPLERDEIIQLLNRLGSDRDEDVLAAAREVHARISAAGTRWEDLLVPESEDEDVDLAATAEPGEPAPESGEPEDAAATPPAEPAADNAESLRLIEKLLARSDISADLREELESYKSDIAEGEFTDGDRRYLRALYGRLT